MKWLWRKVQNPSANSVVVDLKACRSTDGTTFDFHGIYISHDATSSKRYIVRTFKEGTNETRDYFDIYKPSGQQPFVFTSDTPLIVSIGLATGNYYEHLQVIAVDGGETNLSIGVLVKGIWRLVTDMYG